MADKHIDPEDPFTLTGHAIPITPEESAQNVIEMTDALIHEFAMLGWSLDMIAGMFKKPFYRMPHMILQSQGEDFVRGRILKYFNRAEH